MQMGPKIPLIRMRVIIHTSCLYQFQSEPDGFADFHLYVCAAFLVKFEADLLREKDFHVRYVTFIYIPYSTKYTRLLK